MCKFCDLSEELCTRRRDKGLGDDPCIQKKECTICRCPVLTSHSQRATQLEIQTIPVSSEISLLKLPDLQGGTGCMLRRTLRVQQYTPGHRILQNSTIHSAGWLEEIYLLPHPPGPSVKSYSGGGREQPENRQ